MSETRIDEARWIVPMQLITSPSTPGRLRPARNFALGVVATVAAGIAVSATIVGAAIPVGTPAQSASTFVPITPCRLMDTRPGDGNVGPRATPLAEGEIHVQQVTGANGDCNLPSGITGVALNATAIRPTARTFLTFFPTGADLPNASNLNTTAGQPPTPNKVDVRVSDTGAVSIFNAFGEVHLAVDVAGYYTAAPTPFATTDRNDGDPLGASPSTVVSAVVRAPSDGAVIATSTTLFGTLGGGLAVCSLSDDTAIDATLRQIWNPSGAETSTVSGTRTFPVAAGQEITVRLVCRVDSGNIGFNESNLTALFVPSFVDQPMSEAV